MEFLYSKLPPLHKEGRSFESVFYSLLETASVVDILVGYISSDSLTDLKHYIETNSGPKLNLTVGMHFFEGFSKIQYKALSNLAEFIGANELGIVSLANRFPFHGKLYCFCSDDGENSAIVGSSNLSNIMRTHPSYELDLLLDAKEEAYVKEARGFIESFRNRVCIPFSEYQPLKFKKATLSLEDVLGVRKVSELEIEEAFKAQQTITFEIPIKATASHKKSNLNVFFGKGRENKKNRRIKPRHWYEAEIIVSREITDNDNYPKSKDGEKGRVFTVITDDGWSFECQTNGDYAKNFRSSDDLTILGRWLKGRLENSGCLTPGELVTEKTLLEYGRNSFSLKATKDPNLWLLDFGVAK